MTAIDEARASRRIAEVRLRGVLAEHLVAPGAAERVGHDRQQFDVCEFEVLDIRYQLSGELIPIQRPPIVPPTPPRSGVHLVDRHRRVQMLPGRCPRLHPLRIAPVKRRRIGHDRRRARRNFGLQRHRIGLERQQSVWTENLELVNSAHGQARNEQLPDAGFDALAHAMAAAIPAVEVPDHRDPQRVGRPDGKSHPGDAGDVHRLGTEAAPELEMIALGQQIDIQLAEQQTERIRVLGGLRHPTGPMDPQPVGRRRSEASGKQSLRLDRPHFCQHCSVRAHDVHALGRRHECANNHAGGVGMRTEPRERISGAAGHERRRSCLVGHQPRIIHMLADHDGHSPRCVRDAKAVARARAAARSTMQVDGQPHDRSRTQPSPAAAGSADRVGSAHKSIASKSMKKTSPWATSAWLTCRSPGCPFPDWPSGPEGSVTRVAARRRWHDGAERADPH